ncbi:MAG: LUD domain-containing protein [Bacilli bacterium]
MDYNILIKNLRLKNYEVSFFNQSSEASAYLIKALKNVKVGLGDSKTIESLDLKNILGKENEVIDLASTQTLDEFLLKAKETLTSDIFITSVNAVAISGEMINIDGSGNRIAASLFGHQKVYFIFGINKVVSSLDDAINRARNIAAPLNARRLKRICPCSTSDETCFDCTSKDRICNALVIYLNKMEDMEVEIIIINEELGF